MKLSNFSNSVACSSGKTRVVLVTLEVTAEAECVFVANPGDVVREAECLLLALVERIVWSAKGKLRHVRSGSADEVAQAPRAGTVVEQQRRIGDAQAPRW